MTKLDSPFLAPTLTMKLAPRSMKLEPGGKHRLIVCLALIQGAAGISCADVRQRELEGSAGTTEIEGLVFVLRRGQVRSFLFPDESGEATFRYISSLHGEMFRDVQVTPPGDDWFQSVEGTWAGQRHGETYRVVDLDTEEYIAELQLPRGPDQIAAAVLQYADGRRLVMFGDLAESDLSGARFGLVELPASASPHSAAQ